MAINITLAGNIKDSNNNSIDAKLQVFIYNKNKNLTKWSDIFETEDTDYDKNIGDPDLSGQDNSLQIANTSGEFAIIAVWKDGERDSTDNIPSEFAYIFHELNGDDVYLQDITLKSPNSIGCSNWEVQESIIQGEPIIALNHNTNEMTYTENDFLHFLYKEYKNEGFREIIFPFMGTKIAEYSFNNEEYSTGNVYIPEEAGDCNIKIRVQDYFNNTADCEKITKVYYLVQCCFNVIPGVPKITDKINISNCSTGHVTQIQETKYSLFQEEHIGNFDFDIPVFGEFNINQIITYFNGYENVQIECNKLIQMENIPPELNLETIKEPQNELAKKDYTFAHNGTDIDGYIEKVEWQIYRNNPDIEGNENWNLYFSTGPITDLSDWSYNIDDIIGDLRVRAIVYDNLGASAFQEFDIANDCSDIMISFDNIDWTKKIKTIDFSTNIIKTVWKQEVKKIQWEMKTKNIQWENVPKKIQWKQEVKGINFKYKVYTKI